MLEAIIAFLQSIPVLGSLLDKLIPDQLQRRIDAIHKEKKREREQIDDWIDRGGPPTTSV